MSILSYNKQNQRSTFQPSFSCFDSNGKLKTYLKKAFLVTQTLTYDEVMGGFVLRDGKKYRIKAECFNPYDLLAGKNICSFQEFKENFAADYKIPTNWVCCKPLLPSVKKEILSSPKGI